MILLLLVFLGVNIHIYFMKSDIFRNEILKALSSIHTGVIYRTIVGKKRINCSVACAYLGSLDNDSTNRITAGAAQGAKVILWLEAIRWHWSLTFRCILRGATTLSITTLSIMTQSIMKFSITINKM